MQLTTQPTVMNRQIDRQLAQGRHMLVSALNGALPFKLPVTAQQWSDRLCAVSDRAFSDRERALLPAGVEIERPCAESS